MMFSIKYLNSEFSNSAILKVIELYLRGLSQYSKHFKIENKKILPISTREYNNLNCKDEIHFANALNSLLFITPKRHTIIDSKEIKLFKKWLKKVNYSIVNNTKGKYITTYKHCKISGTDFNTLETNSTAAATLVHIFNNLFGTNEDIGKEVHFEFCKWLDRENKAVSDTSLTMVLKKQIKTKVDFQTSNTSIVVHNWEEEEFTIVIPKKPEIKLY